MDGEEFRLSDLDFHYSCEIENLREPSEDEREQELKREFLENIVDREMKGYDKEIRIAIRICIRNMLDMTNWGITKAMKYVEQIILLKKVAGDTDLFKRLYSRMSKFFADKVEKPLDQLIKSPDKDAKILKEDLDVLRDILTDSLLYA